MQNEPTLLTITQAAEFLKVSPDTLRRWEAKGIVTPQRTKGGSRRYTLLDLKIAKLNKKKTRLSQISSLFRQNYINHKRDLKIAMFTSFVWIFALLVFHFTAPVFLQPTSPEHQVSLESLKKQEPLKISAIRISLLSDSAPKPVLPTTGTDIISNNLPSLKYTENPNQYYSLTNLNKKKLTTLDIF